MPLYFAKEDPWRRIVSKEVVLAALGVVAQDQDEFPSTSALTRVSIRGWAIEGEEGDAAISLSVAEAEDGGTICLLDMVIMATTLEDAKDIKAVVAVFKEDGAEVVGLIKPWDGRYASQQWR